MSDSTAPELHIPQPPFPLIEPQAVALVILSLIAFLVTLPPMVWHAKSKNTAICMFCVWLVILNLFNVVNGLIWPNDNIFNQWQGYGLCDIETKLQVATTVGLTGSLLATERDLCMVMNTNRITLVPTTKQRWINKAVTGTLVFGFPAYIMIIDYLVQPSRYYIFTLSGCTPSIDNSWLGLVLELIWPLIFAIVTAVYSVLLCFRMHRYKSEFSQLLTLSQTTKSRFLRLFIMSSTLILILLPIQIYTFLRNLDYGIIGYSFAAEHQADWGYIQIIPSGGQVIFDRWIRVVASYLVFLFFGLGDDALRMYRLWLRKIGLGKIFPSINSDAQIQGLSFGFGTWNTLNAKARSFLEKRKKTSGDTGASDSMPCTSISTAATANDTFSPKTEASADSPRESEFKDVTITKEVTTATEKKDLEA